MITTLSIKLGNLTNVNELKAYGKYTIVKQLIKEKTGITIKSKDWDSLILQLQSISYSIEQNKEELAYIVKKEDTLKTLGNFSETKKYISKLVSHKITAHSWIILRNNIIKLISVFLPIKKEINKYDFFEKNKRVNFINSSKLEGIIISNIPSSKNMADVIKKYKIEQQNG